MRPSQKSNRARGRGGRKPNGNVVNRVFESAGPEGKVRGTPQQIIDKYLSLARDAQTSGDRVISENFLQHAEHYQRILIEAVGPRPERRETGFGDQDQPDADGEDFGDGDDDTGRAETVRPAQAEQRQPAATAEQGDAPRPAPAAEQPRPRRDTPEISGLTTIDSGDANEDNLLIDGQELTASQPRRRNRRRGRPQGEEGAEGAESTEGPSETGAAAE